MSPVGADGSESPTMSMPKPENNAKKLAVMIDEVKAEIAEQKQKVQQQSLSEIVMQ